MNYGLYIIIFLSKVLENSLATLRLIVVANGKKNLGAILQFLITLVWVLVTGTVVKDIGKDPLTIFFFAFGAYIGSYTGSFIEQKMAMGTNLVIAVINPNKLDSIIDTMSNYGFSATTMDGHGIYGKKKILFIMIPRKKRKYVVHIIKNIDKKAMILSETTKNLYGGYLA